MPDISHLDHWDIAKIIFDDFNVSQSVTIKGFLVYGEDVVPKGEQVLNNLREMDKFTNLDKKTGRRKRVILPNTIGGWVAQKCFKWKQEIRNKQIVIMIWRIQ